MSEHRDAAQPLTVMVVDDDALVRTGISSALKLAGFKVVDASTGAEAVSILESGEAINAIFSDISMPGEVDGLALAQIVLERFDAQPLILTSGGGTGRERAERAKIPFIGKPYSLAHVVAAIAALLAKTPPGTGKV